MRTQIEMDNVNRNITNFLKWMAKIQIKKVMFCNAN